MPTTKIGDQLRLARVNKKISLDRINEETKIPLHYLLALELGQFTILPQDKIDQYLLDYAKLVDLDGEVLLTELRTEQEKPRPVDDREVDNPVNQELTIEKKSATVPAHSVSRRRSSRHSDKKSRGSYIPLITLVLMALAILCLVFYAVLTQKNQQSAPSSSSYSVVNQAETTLSTETTVAETTTSTASNLTVTTLASNQLQVHVASPDDTATVNLTLSAEGTSSWVAVSGSELGEAGTTLTAENPSYQTTLPAGTGTSLITIGLLKGVGVTINNQPVDFSSLTGTDLTYINLVIE